MSNTLVLKQNGCAILVLAPGKEPGITGDTNCKGLLCADQALDTHFSFNISEVIFAVKYLK